MSAEIKPTSRRWIYRAPVLTLMGAAIALIIPVLIYGPWLPLIDLVSFVGMYSYPPTESYGPLHYYVFQFSFVGVLTISRILSDLHLPVQFQIPVYYWLQMGICLGVVYASIRRLISSDWWRCVGIAVGTLALWDGIFLWGGPLGFTLGARALTIAAFLVMRDAAEPDRNSGMFVAVLFLFSLCCHPFMFPFILVICGIRFVFDRGRRIHTAGLVFATMLFTYIILRDSPPSEVGGASGGIRLLFGFDVSEIWQRVSGLFTQDALFAETLFGTVPWTSRVVFLAFAFIHLIGFLACPYIAIVERDSKWVRMIATLTATAGLMYVFSWNKPQGPIGDWPQRILTFYAPFTYLGGFTAIVWLWQRFRRSVASDKEASVRIAWAVPGVIIVFAAWTQAQVFAFGRPLQAAVDRTRSQVIDSGATNAYLVVSGIDRIHPFYLRCVPFVLFSDREIVAKHLFVSTEWHVQARHPSRVVESTFNLGRKRYLAEFSMDKSELVVGLVEHNENRFPLHERTNVQTWMTPWSFALREWKLGIELLNQGLAGQALEHFNTSVYAQPQFLNGWNDGGVTLLSANRPTEAVGYFEQAVKQDPKHVLARTNLGLALLQAGRPSDAIPHLETALSLKPDNAEARMLLEKARSMKDDATPTLTSKSRSTQ